MRSSIPRAARTVQRGSFAGDRSGQIPRAFLLGYVCTGVGARSRPKRRDRVWHIARRRHPPERTMEPMSDLARHELVGRDRLLTALETLVDRVAAGERVS